MNFRDQVARDRAWARYLGKKGLRGVVAKTIRSDSNTFRLANYTIRRAKYEAAQQMSGSLVRLGY